MDKDYTPYDVTDGVEHLVADSNGDVWAGSWQRKQMDNSERITIGYYDDPIRGPKEIAGLPKESLLKHTCITGTTGYGKSALLRNIQLQFLEDGHGMCFIDPKGSDSRDLLRQLPAERTDDVVWIQPGSEDNAIGFNVFDIYAEPGDERYEYEVKSVAEDFRSLLETLTDLWGPRLDTITEELIEQLIRADESYSPIDMTKILTDPDEMDAFIDTYEDSLTDAFRERVDQLNQSELDPLIARLQNLVGNRGIRQTMANSESELNFSEVVEEDKILIVDTRVLDRNEEMILNQIIISRIWSTIQSRTPIPHEERKPFYLCIDEFDKVVNADFDINDIISMSRSYRLGVFCSFQLMSQLADGVQSSVRQMQTHISLNPGPDKSNAASVAQQHGVGAIDMTTLDPHEAMFKPITNSGYQSDESVTVTLFAEKPPQRESAVSVIKQSLETYGTSERISTEMEDYGVTSEQSTTSP